MLIVYIFTVYSYLFICDNMLIFTEKIFIINFLSYSNTVLIINICIDQAVMFILKGKMNNIDLK